MAFIVTHMRTESFKVSAVSDWRMRIAGTIGKYFKAVECGVFHLRY
jgi:hypothetical protein